MGFVPPPRPLTENEFTKRWNTGARTLEELDTNLMKWKENNNKPRICFLFILAFLLCVFTLIFMQQV